MVDKGMNWVKLNMGDNIKTRKIETTDGSVIY